MINLLDKLNDSQCEAVTYCDGAQLVIAGAGSGKTRVLTYKIAYLLQQRDLQLMPWNILALTFTNKAAKEMKQRIGELVGQDLARALFMGTFHSIFARILRHESSRLGYTSRFTIYDDADSRSLISTIVKEMGLSDKEYKASSVLHRIGMAKNRLITADKYANEGSIRTLDAQQQMPELYKVYRLYEQRCKMANAMDFDDLLVNTWKLFNQFPDVCAMYAERFKYILVDEYQDTNYVQQCIIYQLAKEHKRICVVGDDAQSIYGFRGANIDNILSFERQYAGAKMFKLERNYRSTQTIVEAANSLIAHNQRQIRKDVYSENSKGDKLQLFEAYSDRLEAVHVCDTISKLKLSHEGLYSDYAILYRTNAQSRLFEDELRKRGIPYTIYGGLSFYQRKEIKDIISYFRAIINPDDEEALKRIINYPTRGIGATTIQKIVVAATENEVSLWDVISQPSAYNLPVNKGTATKIEGFVALLNTLRSNLDKLNAAELGERVIRDSAIHSEIFSDNSPEGLARQENIEELTNELQAFVDDRMEEDNRSAVGLVDFLQEVSLLSDIEHSDNNDEQNEKGAVSLMTIHAAKGLEFPVVFIVGLEENIFPSLRSCDSMRLLEEERRLLYVAITRAEQNCYLSCAKTRYRFGKTDYDPPSRFIKDIDPHYIQHVMQDMDEAQFGDNWNKYRALSFGDRTSFRRKENRSDDRSDNYRSTSKQEYTSSALNKSANGQTLSKARNHSSFKKLTTEFKQPIRSTISEEKSPIQTSVGGLSQGTIIDHQRFGRGEVQRIEGKGENLKVTVKFEGGVGTKQLLVKFARFTIVKS